MPRSAEIAKRLRCQLRIGKKTCNVDFGVGGIFCGVAKMLIQDKVCFWDIEGASRKKNCKWVMMRKWESGFRIAWCSFSSLTYLWILKIQIVIYDKSDFTTFFVPVFLIPGEMEGFCDIKVIPYFVIPSFLLLKSWDQKSDFTTFLSLRF